MAAHDVADRTTAPRLSVTYEWGALREVVVGGPYGRIGSGFPRFIKNFTSPATIAYLEKAVRAFPRKRTQDAAPALYQAMTDQIQGAIGLLRGRGIVVHQVPPFDRTEEAYLAALSQHVAIQAFPRDPILVIGNRLIETAMYGPYRRKERFAIRRGLADRLTASGTAIVSLPEPIPGPEGSHGFPPGAYLEGGDVFLLGQDIYVGLTGNASSIEGVRSLQAILGPGYRVHPIRLSPKFLHLDCVLSTPRPGLALVCKEGFVDGLPSFLSGWNLIDISADDAEQKLATNVLVLDENTVLVASETPTVAEALSRAGQQVITAPFAAVFMWGGAFRCWHHPLIREGGSSPKGS